MWTTRQAWAIPTLGNKKIYARTITLTLAMLCLSSSNFSQTGLSMPKTPFT